MSAMWWLLWPGLAFVMTLLAALALRSALLGAARKWARPAGALATFADGVGGPSLLWCLVLALYVAMEVALELSAMPPRPYGRPGGGAGAARHALEPLRRHAPAGRPADACRRLHQDRRQRRGIRHRHRLAIDSSADPPEQRRGRAQQEARRVDHHELQPAPAAGRPDAEGERRLPRRPR